jgi:hypothetical protein
MHKALGSQRAGVDSPFPLLSCSHHASGEAPQNKAEFFCSAKASSTMPISQAPQLAAMGGPDKRECWLIMKP